MSIITSKNSPNSNANSLPLYIEVDAPHDDHLAAYKLGAFATVLPDGNTRLFYSENREQIVELRAGLYEHSDASTLHVQP